MVYVCLLAGIIIVGVLLCRNKTGNLIYCILAGIALFVVAAFRRSVGHDYNSYGWMYINYMSLDIEEIAVGRTEKGYAIINKLLADYILEYQWIFIIMAAFFAVCTAVCVYKYCKRPYIGFAFFLTFGVYFNTLNFLRQMAAGFIMLYAFRFIRKNQFGRFLIFVLLATCFHRSAIVMIPFYFILRIKLNYVSLSVYAGLTAVFMLFSWQLIDFFAGFFFSYKTYMLETNPHMAYGVNPIYMFFFGAFFILAFLLRKRLEKKDEFNNIWLNCLFFTFLFELIGVKHSIISRLGVYFIVPVVLIYLPRVFECVLEWCRETAKKDKKKLTLCTAASIAAIAVVNFTMFGFMIANGYNGVMPYRTMFENFGTEAAE